jgi:hypothetical protein
MAARISVPADKVRTREQILAGRTIRQDMNGVEYVYVTCHNCGGSGTYPSAMIPPGQCRLYCWQDRTPETYGKLPVLAETYVKREQASDRRAYRAAVKWELEAPARAEAARLQAERQAAEELERARIAADVAERKAISQYLGVVGERMEVAVTVTRVASYQTRPFRSWSDSLVTRYVITMRDPSGNVLVWFSEYQKEQGDTLVIRATVKEHKEYQGEKQTIIQRVKEIYA